MFLKLVCLTIMLANNTTAGINTLYEGAPHMLTACSMLATTQLEAKEQAAPCAAFLMINL